MSLKMCFNVGCFRKKTLLLWSIGWLHREDMLLECWAQSYQNHFWVSCYRCQIELVSLFFLILYNSWHQYGHVHPESSENKEFSKSHRVGWRKPQDKKKAFLGSKALNKCWCSHEAYGPENKNLTLNKWISQRNISLKYSSLLKWNI